MKFFKSTKWKILLIGVVIILCLLLLLLGRIVMRDTITITQFDDGKTFFAHIGEKIIVSKSTIGGALYTSDNSILYAVSGLSEPGVSNLGPKSAAYNAVGTPTFRVSNPGTATIYVQHDCLEAFCQQYKFIIIATP